MSARSDGTEIDRSAVAPGHSPGEAKAECPDDSGVDFKTSSPSPLAFTVSFDDGEEVKPKPLKKLGSKRFTSKSRPVLSTTTTSTITSGKFIPPLSKTTASSVPNNDHHSKNPRDHQTMTTNNKDMLNKSPILLVDEENNVLEKSDLPKNSTERGGPGSETGTYTIDQDDEATPTGDTNEDNMVEEARKNINNVFGLNSEDNVHPNDWVSQWAQQQTAVAAAAMGATEASSTLTSSPVGSGNSGINKSDDSCNTRITRRKLPSLPPGNKSETEDYLQDTLTAMNAIEARISEDESGRAALINSSPLEKTPKSRLTNGSSASAYRSKKIEELEAWKRRKNYRPTSSSSTSVIKPKTTSSSPLNSNKPSLNSSSNSRLTMSNLSTSLNNSNNNRRCDDNILNRSINSASNLRLQKSVNSGNKKPLTSTSSLTGGLKPRTNSRSASTMSSKDAEFQAWKRRKNYNPLAAVASANQQRRKQQKQSSRGSSNNNGDLFAEDYDEETTETEEILCHSLQTTVNINSQNQAQQLAMPPRSASFHYPDGRSRIQHNVYTSEEESLEEEDVLMPIKKNSNASKFLSDVGGSSSDAASCRNALSTNHHRSGSSQKNKLEALDNLVISTIFSVSTKLCINSQSLLQKAQSNTSDMELSSIIDTLMYVLDDTDPPLSPSKKTSRELSGTLRNLKKVEQVLQIMERVCFDDQ